jgi:hypothetical protein
MHTHMHSHTHMHMHATSMPQHGAQTHAHALALLPHSPVRASIRPAVASAERAAASAGHASEEGVQYDPPRWLALQRCVVLHVRRLSLLPWRHPPR